MSRPIEPTPVLEGEAAEDFLKHLDEPTPKEIRKLIEDAEEILRTQKVSDFLKIEGW